MKLHNNISAVLIAKNEERHIRQCINALIQVTDDVVVLDSGSTDATVDIATSLGAKVHQTSWQGYAATKNLANTFAKYDWILSIDADEVLSEDLIETLCHLQPKDGVVYTLDRINYYCGYWVKHSGWYPDWKPRLFNRKTVHWTGDYVHEQLKIPDTSQRIKLKGKLLHYSYYSKAQHLAKIEHYTTLSAQEMFSKGKRVSVIKIWLAPFWRFIRTFFLKFGFLDGAVGWEISKSNAYLARLKYEKLKKLQHNKKSE